MSELKELIDDQPPAYAQGYPPQQPGFQPQQPNHLPASEQQSTTAVVDMPPVTIVRFSQFPMTITCPQCRQTVVTDTSYETGSLTWLACFWLAICGCCLGCCFIPFCIDRYKNIRHYCPNCNTSVGVYSRGLRLYP